MRKLMPAGELARDDRFVRITMEDVIFDPETRSWRPVAVRTVSIPGSPRPPIALVA